MNTTKFAPREARIIRALLGEVSFVPPRDSLSFRTKSLRGGLTIQQLCNAGACGPEQVMRVIAKALGLGCELETRADALGRTVFGIYPPADQSRLQYALS